MKQGGNTSSVEYSKRKIKQKRYKRAAQTKRWESRSGEVITRKISDEKVTPPPPTPEQLSHRAGKFVVK